MNVLASEFLKVRTAPRTALILVVSMIALAGLGAAGISYDADQGMLENPESDIVDVAEIATFIALIFGILIVTWDYRHGTIVQTFLAEPHRERVLVAKLAVAVAFGAALVLLALAVAVAVAKIWLGSDFDVGAIDWGHVGRLVVAAVLWAIIGLGLGATLQTQVGALMTALIWFLVVENILVGLGDWIRNVGDYLPGTVLDEFATDQTGELGTTTAGLLGAGYALLFAAAGLVSVVRRDVG